MKLSLGFALGLAFAGSAYASDASLDLHLAGRHLVTVATPIPNGLSAGTYAEPIDHAGDLAGQTFSQRYWIDSEYATSPATAPVIYHICGEADCTQDYFLNDNAVEWAKALHANLAYLEHRYYGESLPFTDLSNDHMKYLTLNNAIEDLASFQKWISAKQGWSGKWVVVGGSYSGTLSAIYRFKHPELVVGSLAASAPMISGTATLQDDDGDMGDLSSTDPSGDTGDRQWVYQACTTFGFWQTDGFTIFTPSQAMCQKLFGAQAPYADSKAYNQSYELPFITNAPTSATNIMFSYGSEDMWTTIGVSSSINQNPGITISVIQGAGHHFDLNPPASSDTAAVVAARQQFQTLAAGWLGITQ